MKFASLLLAALAITAPAAQAQSYDDLADVQVLKGWRMDDGSHMAALQITLQPGWVTYWRAPGDAGIPPQFVFRGDGTVSSITPFWPTPTMIESGGMMSIGYRDQVTVPLWIDVDDQTGAFAVSGEISIGVCEEICIPVTIPFGAVLPATGAGDHAIDAALAAIPVSADAAGVGDVVCSISPTRDGLRLTTRIDLPAGGTASHVVVEAPDPSIWVSEADVSRVGATITAQVDMVHPAGNSFALDRSGLRFTVLGDTRAIDIRGCSAG